MTHEEYLVLYKKHLAGNATLEEVRDIMTYKDDFDFRYPGIQDIENFGPIEKRILNRLNHSNGQIGQKRKSVNGWWWSATAAILVMLFAGLFVYTNSHTNGSSAMKKLSLVKNRDVRPGGNKAILTLANGKQILLADAANGTISRQGSIADF